MEPFTKLTSHFTYLNRDHLDNNDIIPGLFGENATKKQAGQYLFNNIKYLPGLPKKDNPDFPLNYPENKGNEILIPGLYFATEIDLEQSAWAVLGYGFRIVISNTFGFEFKKHSYRNGLLPIELTPEEIAEIAAAGGELTVTLADQKVTNQENEYFFSIDPDYKEKFMKGFDDVKETMSYIDQIAAYETQWNSFYRENM